MIKNIFIGLAILGVAVGVVEFRAENKKVNTLANICDSVFTGFTNRTGSFDDMLILLDIWDSNNCDMRPAPYTQCEMNGTCIAV